MKTVICGAGIAGLALAQRLGALGWDVLVVEQAAAPREQGHMIDFWGLGYDAAERMGALPRLRELSYPVTEWTYVDDQGRRRAALDQTAFARAQHGRLLTVMRPHIELAIREQVSDAVEVRYGCTVETIEDIGDGVRLTLSDGTAIKADLLVGADGIHSTVRHQIFGAEQPFLRYLGFHMAVWLFDDPEIHRELAHRFCFTDTYNQQVGLYGLRDGRVAAFAVHRTTDPAVPDDTQRTVRETYRSLGWVVPHALAKCPPAEDIYYDQMAQIELPRWSQGRVTLLGDACGAVSPLASQGASLAVAGAYLLARQLETAESVTAALAAYQHIWQPVVETRQRGARRGAQWFLPDSARQLRVRRTGVRLTSLPGVSTLISMALSGRPTADIDELSRRGQAAATR